MNEPSQQIGNTTSLVLYRPPEWQVKRTLGKYSSSYQYYIYELGIWMSATHMRGFLLKVGLTPQEWYDRWILGITVPSDRPRCQCEHCKKGNPVTRFIGLHKGYFKYCDESCSRLSESRRESLRSFYDSGGAFGVVYRNEGGVYTKSIESIEYNAKYGNNSLRTIMNDPVLKAEFIKLNPTIQEGGLTKFLHNHADEYSDSLRRIAEHHKSGGSFAVLWRENRIHPYDHGGRLSRNYKTGWYTSSKFNKKYWYRSSFELRFLEIADSDDTVSNLEYEQLSIPYIGCDGKPHTYKPDYLVTYVSGLKSVIEIKPKFQMDDETVKLKSEACIAFCERMGFDFIILNEDYLYGKTKR